MWDLYLSSSGKPDLCPFCRTCPTQGHQAPGVYPRGPKEHKVGTNWTNQLQYREQITQDVLFTSLQDLALDWGRKLENVEETTKAQGEHQNSTDKGNRNPSTGGWEANMLSHKSRFSTLIIVLKPDITCHSSLYIQTFRDTWVLIWGRELPEYLHLLCIKYLHIFILAKLSNLSVSHTNLRSNYKTSKDERICSILYSTWRLSQLTLFTLN